MKKSTRQAAKKLLIPMTVVALMLGALLWAGDTTEKVRAQNATSTATPAPQIEDLPPLDDKINPPKYPILDSNLNGIVEQAESRPRAGNSRHKPPPQTPPCTTTYPSP